ncbi:MAG: type I-G CRISPR-associated protein Csb2, partial [Stellaceae bacterium]
MPCLLISVRFHDGRYHGVGGWPPSPARLFQALVAGAARGESLSQRAMEAFKWLEGLDAPVITAPPAYAGQGVKSFVPNNDLDAVGGDPARVGEIRAAKIIRPRLFDAERPLLYAWMFEQGADAARHARTIRAMADDLYQLGRGIDMAWARAEVVEEADAEARLRSPVVVVWRPNSGGEGTALSCPHAGSWTSLTRRFAATRARFKRVGEGRKAQLLFSQAPRPDFRQVLYNSPPTYLLFDIRNADSDKFAAQRAERIVTLTEEIRDRAASRLKTGLPDRAPLIDHVFVGRDATEADKAQRLRITPLSSIGHAQTERSIRRVLVAVPPDCPLTASDVAWAFSGLTLGTDPETGEVPDGAALLVPTDDHTMFRHYGVEDASPARLWRSVTPVALPERAARRRIDPGRMREEAKSGAERTEEESKAISAVIQALRHAGISARPPTIRVQREPFAGKGERAEAFAPGTRFAKERLWHVEIEFANAVAGPLIIGDGRYLGLGLMAPVRGSWRDLMVFSLAADARVAVGDRSDLLRAVRRALMALSRDEDKEGRVPPLFSGHAPDGAPAGSGRHEHVFLAACDGDGDGMIDRLIVAAPWICDHTSSRTAHLAGRFDRVVSRLATVHAGRLGVVSLVPRLDAALDHALVGPARVWESHTLYRPTRHAGRGKDPGAA